MNHRFSRFAVVLMLLAPPSFAQDGDAAAPPASEMALSERVVQILWDADAPPPDVGGVLSRLFGDRAAEIGGRILNIQDPQVVQKLVTRDKPLELTDHACKLSFRVLLGYQGNRRPAAKEFADALVEELSPLLADGRREQAALRVKRVTDEYRELEFNLEALRRRSRQKQAELLNAGGRADLSAATLQATLGKLEDERQRLELDVAGMEARLEAVQEQIKSAGQRAKEQAAADPVVAELEKAVAAREELVKIARRQHEAGIAPQNEAAKAEADLVDARVQLLDRRGAASAAGGDALAALTRQMQDLGIDLRDRKARLAHVNKRINPLRDVAPASQELEWMQEESATTRRALDEAQARLLDAQRRLDAAPVDRVIVTNATDFPASNPEQAPQAP